MKTRAEILAEQRRLLLAEIALQREGLAHQAHQAHQAHPFASALQSADIGLRILSKLRKHPEWIALLGLGLATIKPHRLSALLRSGTASLRIWQLIAPLLPK